MADLTNALIGQGIAAGALEIPLYTARVQQAQAQAQTAKMAAAEFQQNAPVRQAESDARLAQLQQSMYQTNATLAKQQSYDAFQRYRSDGDARHLNMWLDQNKSNPVASNLTSDMVRMDNVTRSPENDKILQAAGVADLDGFYNDSAIRNSFVIGTGTDGVKSLIDMNRMYAVTGYSKQLTNEQMEQLSTNASLIGALRKGANLRGLRADSEIVKQVSGLTGMSPGDTYAMLQPDPVRGLDYQLSSGRSSGGGSRGGGGVFSGNTLFERTARAIAAENPEASMREIAEQTQQILRGGAGGGSDQSRFLAQYMQENPDATAEDARAAYVQSGKDDRTAAMKNTEYGEEAKGELDKVFDGDFLNADLNNLDGVKRRDLDKYVTRIEQVGGLELSAQDKKVIRDINKTIGTSAYAAKNLDDAQTGLIDSTVNQLRTYVDNGSVNSKQATLAYNTLGAFVRDGLFGKQVSAADRKDMQKVFASLGAQTGPVLASLKQNLQVQADTLRSYQELGDAYVVKARVGRSIEQLDNTISALNNRIDFLDRGYSNAGSGGGTNSGVKVRLNSNQNGGVSSANPNAGNERPSLNDIWGRQ